MARYLGIDVGGSATRWHLFDASSGSEASGAVAGFSGHLYRPEILAKADHAIASLAERAGAVDGVVAGVTGLGKDTPEAGQLVKMLAARLGARRITLMNDVELAARSAFPPGQGILICAGTGSVAAHLDARENLHVAGGKGVLIDDAGGGYWIAVQALRHILRQEDEEPGSGWRTTLGEALAAAIGGGEWPIVRQAVYGRDRGAIGLLALPVAVAARRSDPAALAILSQAGTELARLALALEGRHGRHEISLCGRAATLHPAIGEGLRVALPGRQIRTVTLSAARAAAEMAVSQCVLAELPPVPPH
ncbi:MAG: ATPase [Methylocystis sp.]|nr:ATPase [Methylocystis sp.]MCA3583867.1 ATPase [Methylocystis sp.]MCA3589655.1 ATPase [Methylocystis sp.]MCA3593173.1 ATPase [Methylocystis sp.]